MIWKRWPAIFIFQSVLCGVTRGDTSVPCHVGGVCILPCSFPVGDEELIHWLKETPSEAKVYSYYYDKEQLTLQSPQFRDRTSLFQDEVHKGNASLRLSGVQVQDEGRYKCYTSTLVGSKESHVTVTVDGPVGTVDVKRTESGFTCSSEGIYPTPILHWSTVPPSNSSLQNVTSVRRNKDTSLLDISSTLTLSHNSNLSVSCTVQTPNSQKKVTLTTPASISVPDTSASISCSLPSTTPTLLLWKFNRGQIIVSQTADKKPEVSEDWTTHLSALDVRTLRLERLTSDLQGTYTCEASDDQETVRSDTKLKIDGTTRPETSHHPSTAVIASVLLVTIVVVVVALAAFYYFCYRKERKGKGNKEEDKTNGDGANEMKTFLSVPANGSDQI